MTKFKIGDPVILKDEYTIGSGAKKRTIPKGSRGKIAKVYIGALHYDVDFEDPNIKCELIGQERLEPE